MPVAYAALPRTEQETAHSGDPRLVVTPLNADLIEEVLKSLELVDNWSEVLQGIREGFDVGIHDSPSRSYLFQESFFNIA